MDDQRTGNLDADDLDHLDEITQGVPWTPQRVCHLLYRFVSLFDEPVVLELACGYGKTTPYLAAAAESSGGTVRTIDIVRRTWEDKSAVDRVDAAGLSEVCEFTFNRDARWYIIELVSVRPGEWIDFVYLDLSHTIEWDAFVALAVWTHLSPGGIVVFDDLDWIPQEHGDEDSVRRTNRPEVKQMEVLFDYLRRLSDVGDSETWGSEEMNWRWGFIQKTRATETDTPVLSQVLEKF